MPATPWALPWPTPDTQSSRGNTAQFPPDGLSTAPAAAAHRLRCKNARECRVAVPASCFGDKSPSHSATAAPCFGSLYPPPAALTFAAQSIICAFGLAAAAPRSLYRHLKLCGIASSLNFPTIAFLLNIDPIYKTGALWQQRAGFVVAGQGSGRYPQSACLTKP